MRMKEITGEQIKSCCAAAYGSDWTHLLIGDSMHPGGVELTERLGDLLELNPGSRVLDVAAGRGASGLALAQRYGCHVTGIDLSPACVDAAQHEVTRSGLVDQATFEIGDAETLGFDDGEFDAVICECAFCTFPDKLNAALGMARVLKPGGRLGLSDLVRRRELPPELQTLAGWVACMADAMAESEYIDCLETAGFRFQDFELHDDALTDLLQRIRGRLFAATVLAGIGAIDIAAADLDQAAQIATAAESAVRGGSLGYVLMTAVKESGSPHLSLGDVVVGLDRSRSRNATPTHR
jgi:arsenite methyltransferase